MDSKSPIRRGTWHDIWLVVDVVVVIERGGENDAVLQFVEETKHTNVMLVFSYFIAQSAKLVNARLK